ncbi:MAG: DUF72 domain-containing protein [Thaumarchaeota archaeon]|nr:DUF72 domain-containing protein [Nitrososphaerota archaeon]MCL5316722.1 DUF72 domain-containing protein [Nitrososphaerota archaeon]
MDIKVGCCGQAGLSLEKYAKLFNVIDLQTPFYRLPKMDTAMRWRETVPENFEFTTKAFQGVTHLTSSPTWRHAGSQRPNANNKNYGHLQQTEECLKSWRSTLDLCQTLRATICVVQMPPSFEYSKNNLEAIRRFFEGCRENFTIGLELRHGSWKGHRAELATILEKVNVLHIVDPLKETPVWISRTAYFRLHGIGNHLYNYKYSDDELSRLKQIILSFDSQQCYVMFNNIYSRDDALRFKQLLGQTTASTSD